MNLVDRVTLLSHLKTLEIGSYQVLMVHASLRKVGPIEGGAETLLDCLLETLGPNGTLLMVLGADDEEPFDSLTTEASEDMGILAEIFRQRPNTKVNDHAAARYGAFGPRAMELLEPIPLHDYHGPGSVLERFTEMGGAVLRLGADVDTVTLTHWAEYLAKVPNKRRVRLRYERADIGEQLIESLDDTDDIADWEGGDYFSQILLDFLVTGRARIGPVGNCTAELFAAKPFVKFAVKWLETNLSPQNKTKFGDL
jgi:aminoglycoside N3'-acetyltransferase